jgi:hypothetical protein
VRGKCGRSFYFVTTATIAALIAATAPWLSPGAVAAERAWSAGPRGRAHATVTSLRATAAPGVLPYAERMEGVRENEALRRVTAAAGAVVDAYLRRPALASLDLVVEESTALAAALASVVCGAVQFVRATEAARAGTRAYGGLVPPEGDAQEVLLAVLPPPLAGVVRDVGGALPAPPATDDGAGAAEDAGAYRARVARTVDARGPYVWLQWGAAAAGAVLDAAAAGIDAARARAAYTHASAVRPDRPPLRVVLAALAGELWVRAAGEASAPPLLLTRMREREDAVAAAATPPDENVDDLDLDALAGDAGDAADAHVGGQAATFTADAVAAAAAPPVVVVAALAAAGAAATADLRDAIGALDAASRVRGRPDALLDAARGIAVAARVYEELVVPVAAAPSRVAAVPPVAGVPARIGSKFNPAYDAARRPDRTLREKLAALYSEAAAKRAFLAALPASSDDAPSRASIAAAKTRVTVAAALAAVEAAIGRAESEIDARSLMAVAAPPVAPVKRGRPPRAQGAAPPSKRRRSPPPPAAAAHRPVSPIGPAAAARPPPPPSYEGDVYVPFASRQDEAAAAEAGEREEGARADAAREAETDARNAAWADVWRYPRWAVGDLTIPSAAAVDAAPVGTPPALAPLARLPHGRVVGLPLNGLVYQALYNWLDDYATDDSTRTRGARLAGVRAGVAYTDYVRRELAHTFGIRVAPVLATLPRVDGDDDDAFRTAFRAVTRAVAVARGRVIDALDALAKAGPAPGGRGVPARVPWGATGAHAAQYGIVVRGVGAGHYDFAPSDLS